MKKLIASVAAAALMATPAFAAQTPSTKTVTTKSGSTKATTTVSTKGDTTTAKTTVTKAKPKVQEGEEACEEEPQGDEEGCAEEGQRHVHHQRLSCVPHGAALPTPGCVVRPLPRPKFWS